MLTAAIAFVAAALSGCVGDDLPPCAHTMMTVGGADFSGHGFVDWSQPEPSTAIIRGPQGGQHVWLSVRFESEPKGRLRLRSALRDLTTDAALEKGITTLSARAKEQDDGVWVVDGLPVFVDQPCDVMNRVCRAWVEATDDSGCPVVSTALITPKWTESCAKK